MEEELCAIEENGTWTLTDLPPGRKAIGLKWVFKVKKDELGAMVRHKARLVVKGYAQCQGIDFEEVYAQRLAQRSNSSYGGCMVAVGSGCRGRVANPPHGCEDNILEWRPPRRSICLATSRLHLSRPRT
jgi:hypothetical protein